MKNDIEQRLKESLQKPFVNAKTFLKDIIFPVFGEDMFNDDGMYEVLHARQELKPKAVASGIISIKGVGSLIVEGSQLDIFDITLDAKKQLQRNRVEIQQIVRSIISTHSGAFIIFHYQSGAKWEWRFTFCHKGASQLDASDAKRYTFLLGPGQSCRTAAENFMKIHEKIESEGEFEMDDIIKAFDVEALSKEFFGKYKEQYEKFCSYIYNNRYDETKFGSFFALCEDKIIRDYVKKLLGRLVFLQFLQKKGWLGASSCEWNDGDRDFLQHLFENASKEQKDDFLDTVLEPMFEKALDGNRAATNYDYDTGVKGFRNVKIPYLNGGLYSKDAGIDDAKSVFPATYFEELFTFFYQYNFTIDENDPNDAEVGIDPEMLGRIFENLLEDNKDKGAFYTPKPIVQYMCKESLIAYLQNGCCTDRARNAARYFVETHDAAPLRELHMEVNGKKTDGSVLDFFDKMLKNVKICDPAIGSGAFPMGLLRELYACRAAIEDFETTTPAEIKKEIIQNNIYGVDIEKGAVDIARLRFWLSLILDEEDPKALPNLDFKIMQGNSLLESFHGVDLSNIAVGKQNASKALKVNARTMQGSIFFQNEQEAMKEIQKCIRRYYSTDSHSAKQMLYAKIESATRQYLYHLTEGRPELQAEVEDLPLCNDQFFLWHTFFADVFEKGGFDIVIGNPPYISAPAQIANETLSAQRENIIKCKKFASLYQKWDLYIPFIEHGIQLLCDGGVTTMIVPYPLTNQTYGKKLRELIMSDYTLFELCDLNGTKIFENATVSNCIPFVRKEKAPADTQTVISHINENREIEHAFMKSPADLVPDAKTAVWNVGEEKRDANRHAGMHVLGDYCYISVGMVINADEKTAKGEFQKEDLISQTQDEIHCRAYIEAKDIEKYRVKRVRYLEYNTERCPDKLRRPTFRELYEHPKLMVNRLGQLQVYYDSDHLLTSDAMFCCVLWHSLKHVNNKSISASVKRYSTLQRLEMEELSENFDLKYLLGVLNSSYADVLLTNLRGGDYHIYPEHIRNIPIAPATSEQQLPIITLVDRILAAKKANPQADTTAEEREIDRLVYDLYGLTEDEIKIVEGIN